MGFVEVSTSHDEGIDVGISEHPTFNQGVADSRPARPTKARRPFQLGRIEKNQGVKTLGQPIP